MNRLQDWATRHGVSPVAMRELATLFVGETVAADESEAKVQADLRVTAPRLGRSLWRNNSGATFDETGRMLRYGLANDSKKLNDVFKSSDLIGITPVTFSGRTFGVFTAVEVKAPGWRGPSNERERAQSNFLVTVESLGGIGMFATSVEDYRQRCG